jgi:zinc protease
MKKAILIFVFCFILVLTVDSTLFSEVLSHDENVYVGTLDNGLTYYIRQNSTPPNQAYFQLVLRGGSVVENDDQRGLSHFIEHLAFWSTENFPDNTVRSSMQSMNATFGASAYFDWVQYNITVPMNNVEYVSDVVLLLSDWAARMTFIPEQVDIEREIVLQEMRGGEDVRSRWITQRFDVAWLGSKYIDRNAIGTAEVIANFDPQLLHDFYNDWYRPCLQTFIAVGDFDVDFIKGLINEHFGSIPRKENPRELPLYTVPDMDDTVFVFAFDEEVTFNNIMITNRKPAKRMETFADYRENLIDRLLYIMLNNRFSTISMGIEPPFTGASAGQSHIIVPHIDIVFSAMIDDDVEKGFRALVTEIERAKQHGFHESELERAKTVIQRQYIDLYNERYNTNSSRWSRIYMNHFIYGSTMLNIEFMQNKLNELLDSISVIHIRNALMTNASEENRGVVFFGKTEFENNIPTEEKFLAIFDEIKNSDLEKYIDLVVDSPLLERIPKRVRVRRPVYDDILGKYTWRLRNGATVHLKTTDYMNDEILLAAMRTGGLSQADDATFNAARMSPSLIWESGLGHFGRQELNLYLVGKRIELYSSLEDNFERFVGNSSVADFETMMQMLWLHFIDPVYDEVAFERWKNRMLSFSRNEYRNPMVTFNEEQAALLYGDNFRKQDWNYEDLLNLDFRTAFDFYTSRFGSANGYNFIFVGNIDKDALHGYIERYIATLPGRKVNTSIIDRNIRLNQVPERRNVFRGIENQGLVEMYFTNDFEFSYHERIKLSATGWILANMLIENIRETVGRLYNISAWAATHKEPFPEMFITIEFGCAPEMADMMIELALDEVRNLLNNNFDDKLLARYKDRMSLSIERSNRTNSAWLRNIESSIYLFDKRDIVALAEIVNSINREDIVDMANKYIDFDKLLKIVLKPKRMSEEIEMDDGEW